MKKELFHGLLAGLLAGVVSVMYLHVYSSNMGVDFSAIAQPVMILISSIAGTVIAAAGYWLLKRLSWLGNKTDLIFTSLFFILSFISIYGTFGAPLPPEKVHPELFTGLVIPMHFFPMLFWLMIKQQFQKQAT